MTGKSILSFVAALLQKLWSFVRTLVAWLLRPISWIRGLPPADKVNFMLSLATFAVAGVTGVLAWETKKLAVATEATVQKSSDAIKESAVANRLSADANKKMEEALRLANDTADTFKRMLGNQGAQLELDKMLIDLQKKQEAHDKEIRKIAENVETALAKTERALEKGNQLTIAYYSRDLRVVKIERETDTGNLDRKGKLFILPYSSTEDLIRVYVKNDGVLSVMNSLLVRFTRDDGREIEPCELAETKIIAGGGSEFWEVRFADCLKGHNLRDNERLTVEVDFVAKEASDD